MGHKLYQFSSQYCIIFWENKLIRWQLLVSKKIKVWKTAILSESDEFFLENERGGGIPLCVFTGLLNNINDKCDIKLKNGF